LLANYPSERFAENIRHARQLARLQTGCLQMSVYKWSRVQKLDFGQRRKQEAKQ
jgi:hypothetical protein